MFVVLVSSCVLSLGSPFSRFSGFFVLVRSDQVSGVRLAGSRGCCRDVTAHAFRTFDVSLLVWTLCLTVGWVAYRVRVGHDTVGVSVKWFESDSL